MIFTLKYPFENPTDEKGNHGGGYRPAELDRKITALLHRATLERIAVRTQGNDVGFFALAFGRKQFKIIIQRKLG